MSRFHSYLNSACYIIEHAEEGKPLSFGLKRFFSAHPQMGARDRKAVSSLCYQYFRCYYGFRNQILPEAVIKSAFICTDFANDFLALHAPELNPHASKTIYEKCNLLNIDMESFFPFRDIAGSAIVLKEFIPSLFVQPDSFLRIRRGGRQQVLNALRDAGIEFSEISDHAIRFKSGQPVDKALNLDEDAVIQDYSSQQVFKALQNESSVLQRENLQIWDCCAASGGKSILLTDLLTGRQQITVSDIRKQSIANLRNRFNLAGIPLQKAFVADLLNETQSIPNMEYDIIIADVPCSGSGTWARTPEQMAWFKREDLGEYQKKQITITKNAGRYLATNGLLFYITCSVFSDENERVVELLRQFGLTLIDSGYICGYNDKADTMFSALFRKT